MTTSKFHEVTLTVAIHDYEGNDDDIEAGADVDNIPRAVERLIVTVFGSSLGGCSIGDILLDVAEVTEEAEAQKKEALN